MSFSPREYLRHMLPRQVSRDRLARHGRMRDRLIHGYFGIDYDIVWNVATHEAGALRQQIQAILSGTDDASS